MYIRSEDGPESTGGYLKHSFLPSTIIAASPLAILSYGDSKINAALRIDCLFPECTTQCKFPLPYFPAGIIWRATAHCANHAHDSCFFSLTSTFARLA